jgi:hypothetical protein
MKKTSLTIAAVVLLLITTLTSKRASAENFSDLAKLLAAWSDVCGDRWTITIESDHVDLYATEGALGEVSDYNEGPGIEKWRLHFRFKVVEGLDKNATRQRQVDLERLRKEGESINHEEQMGHFLYYPKGEKEWDLVVRIRNAEAKVADIPRRKFRSVYLSEEHTMKTFQASERDKKALQYEKDIANIYKLLSTVESVN